MFQKFEKKIPVSATQINGKNKKKHFCWQKSHVTPNLRKKGKKFKKKHPKTQKIRNFAIKFLKKPTKNKKTNSQRYDWCLRLFEPFEAPKLANHQNL